MKYSTGHQVNSNDIVLGIIDNLNKDPVQCIAVDFNVFGDVIVQKLIEVFSFNLYAKSISNLCL